jgi:hypothetical protein
MNKLRCQPGDRCIIIGDVRGCECNIGATAHRHASRAAVEGMPPAWLFRDVSRPIKILDLDRRGNPIPGTESYFTGSPPPRPEWVPVVFDHHLMPLHGEGEPEIDTAAQEKR